MHDGAPDGTLVWEIQDLRDDYAGRTPFCSSVSFWIRADRFEGCLFPSLVGFASYITQLGLLVSPNPRTLGVVRKSSKGKSVPLAENQERSRRADFWECACSVR